MPFEIQENKLKKGKHFLLLSVRKYWIFFFCFYNIWSLRSYIYVLSFPLSLGLGLSLSPINKPSKGVNYDLFITPMYNKEMMIQNKQN